MDAASRKLEFISEDVVDYAVQIVLDEITIETATPKLPSPLQTVVSDKSAQASEAWRACTL
jgi:hypothetical protein